MAMNSRIKAPRKKICVFCKDNQNYVDYKKFDFLRKFITEKGKILPRRLTGCCAKHQRKITEAVKRARMIALLPVVGTEY